MDSFTAVIVPLARFGQELLPLWFEKFLLDTALSIYLGRETPLAISKISCRQTCLPSVSVCYPHFCCSSVRLFPAPWNLVMWCHPIDLVSIGDHLTRDKTPLCICYNLVCQRLRSPIAVYHHRFRDFTRFLGTLQQHLRSV